MISGSLQDIDIMFSYVDVEDLFDMKRFARDIYSSNKRGMMGLSYSKKMVLFTLVLAKD